MYKRDIKLLLEDMHDACQKIIKYTEGLLYTDFLEDEKTVDAVVRNFEIVGEAAARIPKEFKIEHPDIQWNRIAGFRNRIIHEYFGIDYEMLWKIKEQNVPELLGRLLAKLNDIGF
jgi:uncharacterized protein with HEPN domain